MFLVWLKIQKFAESQPVGKGEFLNRHTRSRLPHAEGRSGIPAGAVPAEHAGRQPPVASGERFALQAAGEGVGALLEAVAHAGRLVGAAKILVGGAGRKQRRKTGAEPWAEPKARHAATRCGARADRRARRSPGTDGALPIPPSNR